MKASTLVLLLLICQKILALPIDFSGTISVGMIYTDESISINDTTAVFNEDIDRIGRVNTDLEIRPHKKLRVRTDVTYDHTDQALTVGNLYGRFDINSRSDIRVGYLKKRVSLEEDYSRSELYLDERSMLHEQIRKNHLLGRDFTVAHRLRSDCRRRIYWSALSADIAYRFHLVQRAEIHLKDNQSFSASILGTIGESSIDSTNTITVTAAYSNRSAALSHEVELLWGTNPSEERVVLRVFDDDRKVFHGGARFTTAYEIDLPLSGLPSITPILESSLYANDLSTKAHQLQIRPGLSLSLIDKGLAEMLLSADLRYASQAPKHSSRERYLSSISIRMRMWW